MPTATVEIILRIASPPWLRSSQTIEASRAHDKAGFTRGSSELNIGRSKPVLLAMQNPGVIAPRAREENEENVEVARRSFAAFNRSVAEGTDDYFELLDAEVEWIPITALLDGRTYRGPQAVRRWVDDLKRDWELYEIRWKEARDLGDGRVLVFGTWHARGRRGGVQLSFEQAAWLIELWGGRLIRLQTFTDGSKALEAAGLRE